MKCLALYVILFAGAIAYATICLHSVDEIHYLKSFFPKSFTVEQAFYAAGVELIKVVIIGMAFLMFMGVCAFVMRDTGKSKQS